MSILNNNYYNIYNNDDDDNEWGLFIDIDTPFYLSHTINFKESNRYKNKYWRDYYKNNVNSIDENEIYFEKSKENKTKNNSNYKKYEVEKSIFLGITICCLAFNIFYINKLIN